MLDQQERPKKPHYTDWCGHILGDYPNGIFLDSVIDQGGIVDIYIWNVWKAEYLKQDKPDHSVCIRYGNDGSEYESCFHPAEKWIEEDPELKIGMGLKGPTMTYFNYCRTYRGGIVEVLKRDRKIWDK